MIFIGSANKSTHFKVGANYKGIDYEAMQFLHRAYQGCATCCSLAAGLRENGERMRKWRENEEIERRWRENEEMDRE